MNTKISLIFPLLMILCCSQQLLSQDKSQVKEGMIKVSIFYQGGEGKTFDMEYYAQKHMPMAARLFGEDLKAMSIDKGIANTAPDQALPYVAIGYFYFENMDAMGKVMGTHSETLKADVPNYTNIIPVLQISEVVTAE